MQLNLGSGLLQESTAPHHCSSLRAIVHPTVYSGMVELGVDRVEGAARDPETQLKPHRHPPPLADERPAWLLSTDWVHLSDEQFHEACDELGKAIHCPLKDVFRRRLRSHTAPELLTPFQPSTPSGMSPQGSYISVHVRVAPPCAALCGATEQRLAAARNVPYPITEEEVCDGWDTLINKCWLQCADCNRWRNVPKAVRDEVSCIRLVGTGCIITDAC